MTVGNDITLSPEQEAWIPTISAVAAWRTFPSDYELALLDRWLRRSLGTENDYEARLGLNLIAQRRWLADEVLMDEAIAQQNGPFVEPLSVKDDHA